MFCRGHELVGDPHAVVRILEVHRLIRFSVHGSVIACLNERPCFLLFVCLARDEAHDVRVVAVEHHHFRGSSELAAGFDHPGKSIIPPHELHRARGNTPGGKLLLAAAQHGEVHPGARAELKNDSFGLCVIKDRLHVVLNTVDKTRRTLGVGVVIRHLYRFPDRGIIAPAAGAAAFCVPMNPAVKEHRGVKHPVLVKHECRQFVIEPLGIFAGFKIPVFAAKIGNGARDAVKHLSYRRFALAAVLVSEEVLAAHDVRRMLAPEARHFHVLLLEKDGPLRVNNSGGAFLPHDRIKRMHPGFTPVAFDGESLGRPGLLDRGNSRQRDVCFRETLAIAARRHCVAIASGRLNGRHHDGR